MLKDIIEKKKFSELDVKDPFFASLLKNYSGFDEWFKKKANETAYVSFQNNHAIEGFMYLKEEIEASNDINPPFQMLRRLKIGTFKINAHGTVLSQRFLGIALRNMYSSNSEEVYVTVFEEHQLLIDLFEKFGFNKWGIKKSTGEFVYTKNRDIDGNIYHDFPAINLNEGNNYILSIYPKFHTKMFPDSRLQTEKMVAIEDLSFTNTVEKIYICNIDKTLEFKEGDRIIIYRTAEPGKTAEYNSVATSVCIAAEVRDMDTFTTLEDYLDYCGKGSIFSYEELKRFWTDRRYPYIIKMLYNVPLRKRIVRHDLIEKLGLPREDVYWGCFEITNEQFLSIAQVGGIYESFVVNQTGIR